MLPYVAFGIAVVGAILIVIETYRGTGRWAWIAGVLIIGGSVVAVPIVLTAVIPPPGYALDANGIPAGTLMPGSVRLLTPLFNITGGFALALGALYSTYIFMPKKRVIRYDLRAAGIGRFLVNLAIAWSRSRQPRRVRPGRGPRPVRGQSELARPGDDPARDRRLHPVADAGLSRFGITETFFLGELLGVVFLFAGFLVSGRSSASSGPVHPPRVLGAARGRLTVRSRRSAPAQSWTRASVR